MHKQLARLTLLLIVAWPAQAGDLVDIQVTHQHDRYTITMDALLLALPKQSWDVMRDYTNLPAINNSIHNTKIIDHTPSTNTSRVASVVKVCVWFFCRELQQTQDMRAQHKGDAFMVEATVIPEHSDFHHGYGQWQFRPHAIGTHMHFTATLEPDFWIPPIIGPWLIKRKMRSEAMETIAGIEAAVRAQPTP